MPGRGSLIAALLVLAGACAQDPVPKNEAGPSENAIVPPRNPGDGNEVVPQKTDDPDLSAMTPHQRRAYDRGFADCRAGRYEPAPWPESYRIGCAAAQDR